MPATRANSRIDISDNSRWRRMNSPSEDAGSGMQKA
jgi:hypothetical protein